LALGAVFDHVAGSDEVEVFGVAEEQIELGEVESVGGVPTAAGGDVVDTVARVVNDLAGVAEFEIVILAGTEGFRGDHEEKIVAAASEVETQRIALQDFGWARVHGDGRDIHLRCDVEGGGGEAIDSRADFD